MSYAAAYDLSHDSVTTNLETAGPNGERLQAPAPMGLTIPFINPWTGKIDARSTVYLRSIEDFGKRTGLKSEIVINHADIHEREHGKKMIAGLLPDNYINKNIHEADAEREALDEEHNPTLSAYCALELWAKYQTPENRTPTDWLSTMFKSAARRTFGAANAESFISEYRIRSAIDEKLGKPTTSTYLNLLANYGPGAEARLANNYANELESAGRLISQLDIPNQKTA